MKKLLKPLFRPITDRYTHLNHRLDDLQGINEAILRELEENRAYIKVLSDIIEAQSHSLSVIRRQLEASSQKSPKRQAVK